MTAAASPQTGDGAMRVAAVVDGTEVAARTAAAVAAVAGQADALAAFLRDGLRGELSGQTIALYSDDADRARLIELAPTREVRLVKLPARRPELVARALAATTRAEGIELVLAAGGPAGAELVTRLACRTGGAALTGALDLEVVADRLRGRANVYSAHLCGRFELTSQPWCVSLDPSWNDRRVPAAGDPRDGVSHAPGEAQAARRDHLVLSDDDQTGGTAGESAPAPFADLELVDAPPTDDLAGSRFLVVAGYGAGNRDRLDRIARAARRMGADFGVSRPVVMNAWAPPDRLIGVSGSRAAPDVCVVVGASGAPALYWGIERAGVIVAINPDEHAPIARNADAVVRDDGVAVIEELAELMGRERA